MFYRTFSLSVCDGDELHFITSRYLETLSDSSHVDKRVETPAG